MIGKVFRLALISLILAACIPALKQLESLSTPTATVLASKTATPTGTFTPQPTQIIPPTPSATPDAILISIEAARSSPYWREEIIPDGLEVILDGYQTDNSKLTKAQLATLKDFIEQWNEWHGRLKMVKVPDNENLELRIKEFTTGELDVIGNQTDLLEKRFVIYAINTLAKVPGGYEQLYLLTPQKEPWALPVAPIIEGLKQEISLDGMYVEYYDGSNQRIFKADAIQFVPDWPADQNPYHYSIITGYPRFSLNYPGIKSTIYLMDPEIGSHNLENKIDYAISILNKNSDFAPLRENLFAENFILYSNSSLAKDTEGVVGIASGQSYIQIDPGFDSQEVLLTLVHEAVHLFQARQDRFYLDGCELEIGDGTIPPKFLEYTGEELISSIKKGEIGTIHVELWLASKISAPVDLVFYYTQVIGTKGRGIWDYCK